MAVEAVLSYPVCAKFPWQQGKYRENTGKNRQFAAFPAELTPISSRKQSTKHEIPKPINRENVHLNQRIIRIEKGSNRVRWPIYWLTELPERAEADVRAKRSDRPL